jgi:hypothetical protein
MSRGPLHGQLRPVEFIHVSTSKVQMLRYGTKDLSRKFSSCAKLQLKLIYRKTSNQRSGIRAPALVLSREERERKAKNVPEVIHLWLLVP